MQLSKRKRIIMKIVLSVISLSLPLIYKIYFKKVYYLLFIFLIILQFPMEIFNWHVKLDERFYVRWGKLRKSGFWVNIIWGGLRAAVSMIVLGIIGQFFGNGLTPEDIVIALPALPSSALLIISMLLIFFSVIIGIVNWHENEKRYSRIHCNKHKKPSK